MFRQTSLVLALLLLTPHLHAQCNQRWLPGQPIPGTNGIIACTALWDPDGPAPLPPQIVIGGTFSIAGSIPAQNIAMIDPATGQWSTIGNGFDSRVNALAVLPNGELVAGGDFTNSGSTTVNHVAVWRNSDWLPLTIGTGGEVLSLLALPNNDLIVGGSFNTAGGFSGTNSIARFGALGWTMLGTGCNASVFALAATPTGDIIAGGTFTAAGGSSISRIARWNGSSWSGFGSGVNNAVLSLIAQTNGDIIAGGAFTLAGGNSANHIARWSNSTWSALGSGVNNTIRSILPALNGDLIVAGDFSSAGSVITGTTARWNGASWAAVGLGDAIGTDIPAHTYSLLTLPNGAFSSAGFYMFTPSVGSSINCGYVALLSGTSWTSLGTGLSAGITSFTQDSIGLIAGGKFKYADGLLTNGVARWNGSSWQPLGSGFVNSSAIRSVAALPDGSIAAANASLTFSTVVSFNGSTWNVLGGFSDNVNALLVRHNGRLVAAGNFAIAENTNANRIAEWDGIEWRALGSGVNSTIYSLAEYANGNLVIGAAGNAINNVPDIIRIWDGTSWTTIAQNINATIYALAIRPQDQTLFATGNFASLDSVSASRIASYSNGTWHPLSTGLTGTAGYAISFMGNDVIVGGNFTGAGSNLLTNFARWNGVNWSQIGLGLNAPVFALAQVDGEIALGGSFTSVDAGVSGYFTRWTYTNGPTIALHPTDLSADLSSIATLSATPASGYDTVTYRWFRNGNPIVDGPEGASAGGGTVSGSYGFLADTTNATTTLTISNVQFSDSGQFTCRFASPCGTANTHPAQLSIFCPSDFNHDDVVDFFDYLDFVNAFSTFNPIADFNHDEVLDFFDYLDFVSAFSAGC